MSRITNQAAYLLKSRDLKNKYFSFTFGPYSRAADCKPGQFVHLQLPSSELYFRRAMSVASVDPKAKTVEIIFKVFGRGTRLLAQFHSKDEIKILGPLGRPFAPPKKGETVLMVGGGVGFPPLMYFTERLIENGFRSKSIEFFYGGKTSGDIVERQRIKKLGVNLHVSTDDGSFGSKGYVTAAVDKFIVHHESRRPFRIYACGPDAMLKAVDELARRHQIEGQLSLEAPMPCGIGVCLACVVPLRRGGHARVCVDGPTFDVGEVLL